MPTIIGIYTITNLVDGKIYVGHSGDIKERFNNHKSKLRNNRHINRYLQKAWEKYKEENFVFEILEECSEEFLVALEHYWATLLKAHDREYGYNINPTNPISIYNSPSEETKNRIREAVIDNANKRGYWKTPAQIEKTTSKLRGYKHTEDFKRGCRERNIGKTLSIEQKNSIKTALRKHYYKGFDVFDFENRYINSFGIVSDAVKELNLTKHAKTGILHNLRGRAKSCQGYVFKYKEV